MPSCGLCRVAFVPSWRESGESAGTPFCYSARFGIVRHASQVLEEAQQLIIGAVRSSLPFDGGSLREHLFFQSKIGIEVDLGCLDRFVTQPECDERSIYSRLEQLHSGGVSKHMWCNPLLRQRGTVFPCHGRVFGDEILDGVGTQRAATRAGEQDLGSTFPCSLIHAASTTTVGFAKGVHRSFRPFP
jgi:hypothetical protein